MEESSLGQETFFVELWVQEKSFFHISSLPKRKVIYFSLVDFEEKHTLKKIEGFSHPLGWILFKSKKKGIKIVQEYIW